MCVRRARPFDEAAQVAGEKSGLAVGELHERDVRQLENGVALAPHSKIEGAGDAACIVLDSNFGLGGKFDENGKFGDYLDLLKHLDRNQLLRVERANTAIRIYRGLRVLDFLKARRAA
jgi:hypothetical protein